MRPPTKRVDYKVGDKVEVLFSKEDGVVGSYYEGTIVSCLDEKEKYTVRYKILLKDDESELLTKILFLKDLCPVLPCVRRPSKFKLNKKVDVFDNDGWWIGEITSDKILMQKTYYYNVTIFPTPIKPLTTRVIKLGFIKSCLGESGSWKLKSYISSPSSRPLDFFILFVTASFMIMNF